MGLLRYNGKILVRNGKIARSPKCCCGGIITTPCGPAPRQYAVTRADDNKGKRDERCPLHPVVVDHLRRIVDFGQLVFPWPSYKKALYEEFALIQQAAGIDLPCHEKHTHSPSCHVYGFHDRHVQRRDVVCGDATAAYAAQVVYHDAAVHQLRRAGEAIDGKPVCARRVAAGYRLTGGGVLLECWAYPGVCKIDVSQ